MVIEGKHMEILKKVLAITSFGLILTLFFIPTQVGATDCSSGCTSCTEASKTCTDCTAQNCTDYCHLINLKCSGIASPSNQVCICNPIQATEFEGIIDNIIDFIFKIALVLAPLMVVIGGVLLVTSGGNAQQITQAKNLILWTAIGFFILLLAKGILSLIEQILGVR